MQNLTNHDEFQTCDLQIATALMAAGLQLARLNWQGSKAFFVFGNKQRCEGFVQAYWTSDLRLPAKDYFNSMRELKDRLFSSGSIRDKDLIHRDK
jgi:hypothetical protein